MKKGLSKSSLGPEKPVRRKRKYDEEFKQQALVMVRNGQSPRSVSTGQGTANFLVWPLATAPRFSTVLLKTIFVPSLTATYSVAFEKGPETLAVMLTVCPGLNGMGETSI